MRGSADVEFDAQRHWTNERVGDGRSVLTGTAYLGQLLVTRAARTQPDDVGDLLVARVVVGIETQVTPHVEVAARLDGQVLDLDAEERGAAGDDLDVTGGEAAQEHAHGARIVVAAHVDRRPAQ